MNEYKMAAEIRVLTVDSVRATSLDEAADMALEKVRANFENKTTIITFNRIMVIKKGDA